MRRGAGVVLALLVLTGTAGCGASSDAPSSSRSSTSSSQREAVREGGQGEAADVTTCVADAEPFRGTLPSGWARDFPLPRGTVVTSVRDRGADGVVGTGVVRGSLKSVLAQLNGPAQAAGWKVTTGETEEHDAEANWTGHGYRGRWAIRDSATCPGEVVVQLLSTRG